MTRSFVVFLLPLVLLAGCRRSYAQAPVPQPPSDSAPSDPVADPPGRVARLSYKSGPVSMRVGGSDAWVAAVLNRPLTISDQVWTDDNARAELDLGHAFIRLDSRSSLTILNLDDRGVQISLTEGTAQVRLRRLDENDEFEVSTPQAAITLLRTGDYRFAAQRQGAETVVTVRSGQVEAVAPGQTFTVRAQQQASITGTETVSYQVTPTPPIDGFDDFCQTRDQRAEDTESANNVSPYVIGREDLKEYGSWRVHATYGPVWYPRAVVPSWAPYRFGHWVWIWPWGWTWVDDAPWGFAPFHYGRWIFVGGSWGWVPGPPRIRAVYAPALVVFAGGGPGFRYYFGLSSGPGVAWFPLGPREVYIPPYRASRTYVTNVNISHTVVTNTRNIWNTDMTGQRYINRDVANAITAVPEDVFARGRPVGSATVRVSSQEARSVRVQGSAPPVIPVRDTAATPAPGAPDGVSRRQTTVQRTPAPAPVPLERQRPTLERDPGRPPAPREIEELRRAEPQAAPPRRQVERAPTQQTPPSPRTSPPARPETAPRRSEPAPAPSRRETENRRRSIEQERQRTDTQPGRSQREGTPPTGRR